jgi:tetratricopeptide (TPR) repeat protein
MNLAKAAIKEGRSQAALNSLETAAKEFDALGLKYASIECSIHRAEALINLKDYARARKELETALRKGESIGLRGLLAPAHYMLANVLSVTGYHVEASRHSKESLRLLEEMHREARSDALLQRADLKPIYAKLGPTPPKPTG